MSDDNRQSAPLPLELAHAAAEAMRAQKAGEAEAKQARIDQGAQETDNLLARFWPALGIDPTKYTVGDNERLSWQGKTAFGENGITYSFDTSVYVGKEGLFINVADKSYAAQGQMYRSPHNLPTKPPSDTEIGTLLYTAWVSAHQSAKAARERNLKSYVQGIEQLVINRNKSLDTMAAELQRYRDHIAEINAEEYPAPLDETVKTIEKALAKAEEKLAERRAVAAAEAAAHAKLVETAGRIKSLAIHWQTEQAAYDAASRSLAETVTKHHWRPFKLYQVNYTAIGANSVRVDDEEEGQTVQGIIETIQTFDEPMSIARRSPGVQIQAVNIDGSTYELTIGAFLDGFLYVDATEPPSPETSAQFCSSRRVAPTGRNGSYYFNFPPTMSQAAITEVLDRISYPLPPKPFNEMVIKELGVRLAHYNMQYAHNWADFDPEEIQAHMLDFNVNENTEPEDPEIPF